MTDTIVPVQAPTNPRAEGAGAPSHSATGKKRRTQEELKAYYIAKAAAYDAKREVRHKLDLLKLAGDLKAISDARPADKALAGCVATIVGCANAIKADIPQ